MAGSRKEMSRDEFLDLVERVKSGDKDSMWALYIMFEEEIGKYVRYKLKSDDTDIVLLVDEVLEISWDKLLKSLKKAPGAGGYDREKIARIETFFAWVKRFIVDGEIKSGLASLSKRKEAVARLATDDDDEFMFDNWWATRNELRAAAIALRVAFLCGGFPHQQFSFGFNWLVYGKLPERASQGEVVARRLVGDPKKVADMHGDTPFSILYTDLRNEYLARSFYADSVIDTCMEPLALRLPLELAVMFKRDSSLSDFYAELLATKAGDTCLADYYLRTEKDKNSISDWTDRLRRRVEEIMTREAECVTCKVKHLPPCDNGPLFEL